jgi:hypothetical protein
LKIFGTDYRTGTRRQAPELHAPAVEGNTRMCLSFHGRQPCYPVTIWNVGPVALRPILSDGLPFSSLDHSFVKILKYFTEKFFNPLKRIPP